MILYARLGKKKALENIFTLIKSSNLKQEDTRIEYAKYLGLNTKANQCFVYEYNDVLNYVSKLDLGSGDLSFRLPAFVHNKREQKHAHRMFKEAMNSMRIKSPSLFDLLYVYLQRIILYRLEGSIGGKHIDRPGLSWVSWY